MPELAKNNIVWDSFRKGSPKALEFIYEDNYSALYYYGLKFTPDTNLVKDIIHELFIDLINSKERLAETDNIRYYLLKALRYKIIKQLKANQKFSDNKSDNTDFSLTESVENQLIKKEVEDDSRNHIISAIKKLTYKQQEIIYLRFYNNVPYQEIAKMFGVKIQTVRNLMNRAIQSLKEDFQSNDNSKQIILFLLQLPL